MLVVLKELWPMALTLLTVVMHCLCTSQNAQNGAEWLFGCSVSNWKKNKNHNAGYFLAAEALPTPGSTRDW
jgi:hypothetical protein